MQPLTVSRQSQVMASWSSACSSVIGHIMFVSHISSHNSITSIASTTPITPQLRLFFFRRSEIANVKDHTPNRPESLLVLDFLCNNAEILFPFACCAISSCKLSRYFLAACPQMFWARISRSRSSMLLTASSSMPTTIVSFRSDMYD